VNQFKKGSKLLVAGSSWEGEEQFLSDYAKETGYSSCKILIAPHDVSEVHLQEIEALFEGNIIRYSQYTGEDIGVLLVDNIGILSRAYLHADIAFVGGGFTNKLHNILEPAAHGVPVLFGSNHGKFPEASGLVNASGGYAISSYKDFKSKLDKLVGDSGLNHQIGKNAKHFIESQTGATQIIFDSIFNKKDS
jgi:3-deoxy-D-manno-octulosonic-acid transferase